jgi:hypothetical protein
VAAADHNKVIGILHLLYGGFSLLMMIGMSILFGTVFGVAAARDDFPPVAFIILAFFLVFYVILSLPSFLAGYGLLKRRVWAKVMGIVAAVLAAMSFPFGTALCVYTLWFLFSDQGKALYGKTAPALPPQPPEWNHGLERDRVPDYLAPRIPPDWR